MPKNKKSPIEQWISSDDNKHNHYEELFNPSDDRIDLKTELTQKQIGSINVIKNNIELLKKHGLKPDFLDKEITNYMRLMVSKDRQSRGEYVEVNKKPDQEQPNFTIQQ